MPFDAPSNAPPARSRYESALANAKRDLINATSRLDRILDEKAEIENRVALLKDTIKALTPLCADEESISTPGIKEECGQFIDNVIDPMTVPEIKDALEKQGVPLGGYSNALAVLHTTLNRLAVGGEAKRIKGKDGKVRFASRHWEAERVTKAGKK